MKIEPVVVIDSREQRAWQFENLPSERGTLDTGDYSLRALTHLVAVERKSFDDLLACVGRERDRFRRELQRLRAYRFRALIIECDYADIERGEWRSQLKASHVLGSLAAWQAQYALPIMLVGSHEAGAGFCERFLYQAARCVAAENKAIECNQAVA